jgi:hypothetical protein
MAVKIRTTSRLNFSRLLVIDSVEHWEMAELPIIEPAQDDEIYQVNQEDRIDLISNRKYGNPELWWVIALANGFSLLPNDLKPFSTIRIPSNNRVFNKILRQAAKKKEGR